MEINVKTKIKESSCLLRFQVAAKCLYALTVVSRDLLLRGSCRSNKPARFVSVGGVVLININNTPLNAMCLFEKNESIV